MSTQTPLKFNVLKFSYATDPAAETKNFSWKHVYDGVSVTFDSFFVSATTSRYLHVTQGTQVLEQLNLDEKAAESAKVIEWSRARGIEMRNEQLPIAALYRSPLLAIRYNLASSNEMRRLQLKFGSDSDFRSALQYLQNTGCRVTSSGPEKPQQPVNTPIQDSVGLTYTGAPNSRPGTSASASSATLQSLRPSEDPRQRALSNAWTTPYAQTPTSTEYTVSQGVYQLNRATTLPAQHAISREQPNAAESTPPSAQISTLQDTSYSSLRNMMAMDIVPPVQSLRDDQSATFNAGVTESSSATLAAASEPTMQDMRAVSSHRPSASANTMEGITSLELPPRRDLPFKKPASRLGVQKTSSSRPSTASLELPPLPVPSFATDPPKNRPVTATALPSSRSSFSGSNGFASAAESMRGPPSTLGSISKIAPFPSLTRTVDPHIAPNASVQDAANKQTQPQNSETPVSGQDGGAVSIPNDQSNHAAHAMSIGLPADSFARILKELEATGLGMLSAYAALSEEQRQTILINFVIQHIKDDNFLKLCEDMQGCWQRVALGL